MNSLQKTKEVYENEKVVQGYIDKHGENPKLHKFLKNFSKTINGDKIIDIGCGHGRDAYLFAELGFQVTGIDYSKAMIKAAKNFKTVDNPPEFLVMDMLKLGENFEENSFDAAWACASLLHVPKTKTPQILKDIHKIVKVGGKIYIGLKQGDAGEIMIKEKRYGKTIERLFVFWQKEEFANLAKNHGFKIIGVIENTSGKKENRPIRWLDFILKIEK